MNINYAAWRSDGARLWLVWHAETPPLVGGRLKTKYIININEVTWLDVPKNTRKQRQQNIININEQKNAVLHDLALLYCTFPVMVKAPWKANQL